MLRKFYSYSICLKSENEIVETRTISTTKHFTEAIFNKYLNDVILNYNRKHV